MEVEQEEDCDDDGGSGGGDDESLEGQCLNGHPFLKRIVTDKNSLR